MQIFKHTLLALALAAVTYPALAHRPWLLPSATMAEGKEPTVMIDGAISENYFEFDHMPLKMDSVSIIGPDGVAVATPAIAAARFRSSFDLKMPKPGTYRIAIVNKIVMASYKVGTEVKRFRGTEEAFAKEVPANADELKVSRQHTRLETFVSATQTRAVTPSGAGLELVPVTHPNDLHAGEKASWRFQLDGKPLPNFAFSLIPGGVKYRGVLGEIRLSTDANGVANITLPDAGMYSVNASFPVSSEKGGGANPAANRYTYAATLEILPQ